MAKDFNGADRYAKVWCSIFNDTRFISLSLAERGAWLQLIVWAKMNGDTGIVTFRSWRNLSEILGCDKNTAMRIVRKFAETSLVSHHDLSGIITIEIVEYNEYQRIRKTEVVRDERKPGDISPTNQTRPDQTRPEPRKRVSDPDPEEDGIPYEAILSDLNQRTGQAYRHQSASTRKHIRARFAEGYTLADFVHVHIVKCAEWLNDPKWSKYLRPDTLYSPKFEGYRNQIDPAKQQEQDTSCDAPRNW